MIDLHSHVLPGVDDGPGTPAAAVALAVVAAAEGTSVLVATPHIDERYGVDPASIAPRVAALRGQLSQAGVPLDIRGGGELSLRRLALLDATELAAIRLGGGQWILLECPFQAPASALLPALRDLHGHGLRVLLAHPERCPGLMREPALVSQLVSAGGLCSITAGSISGAFGRAVRDFAFTLLLRGLVHNIASDAHDHEVRPPGLRGALAVATDALSGFGPFGEWLVCGVPAAILSGGEPPARPSLPLARKRSWRPWNR